MDKGHNKKPKVKKNMKSRNKRKSIYPVTPFESIICSPHNRIQSILIQADCRRL